MEQKSFVKKTEEGLYTIAKSGSDLAYSWVNATMVEKMKKSVYAQMDQDYYTFKGFNKYLEGLNNGFADTMDYIHLPSELSWENIKLALQTTYRKALPKVMLINKGPVGKIKSMENIAVESDVKGMMKLSDIMTLVLVHSMWGLFGQKHPLSKSKYQQ